MPDIVVGGYGEVLVEYHPTTDLRGAFIRVSGRGGSVALTGEPLKAVVAIAGLFGIEPSAAMTAAIAEKVDLQLLCNCKVRKQCY